MRYFGGKAKIAKSLVACIQARIPYSEGKVIYVEPFVGGGWVLNAWGEYGEARYASDLNRHLIYMYVCLQQGWIPPDSITKQDYEYYKGLSKLEGVNDPMIAFVGFGCSFAGKWFGGFASNRATRITAYTLKTL
jgi:DNA adenine methylase